MPIFDSFEEPFKPKWSFKGGQVIIIEIDGDGFDVREERSKVADLVTLRLNFDKSLHARRHAPVLVNTKLDGSNGENDATLWRNTLAYTPFLISAKISPTHFMIEVSRIFHHDFAKMSVQQWQTA